MCSAIRFSACITLLALSSQPTTTGKADLERRLLRQGLAPDNLSGIGHSTQILPPGAYTVMVTGKDLAPGIGLVELYDLSPLSNSKLVNMSTRGSVGTGDNV